MFSFLPLELKFDFGTLNLIGSVGVMFWRFVKSFGCSVNRFSSSSMVKLSSTERPFVPISDNIWSVSAWVAFNDVLICQTRPRLEAKNGNSVISRYGK